MPVSPKAFSADGLLDGYTEPERYEAPEADKVLVKQLREFFDDAYNSKRWYEREWETYRLYLKGEVVARHKETGEVVRLAVEDAKKLRSRNNMLRPIARSLIGKLSKMIPTCTTVPATSDFAEQHAARVADAILQFLRRKEDLDVKYLAVNNFLPWAGNAFIEVVWDPTAGSKIAYCPQCNWYDSSPNLVGTPCPQCTSEAQSQAQAPQGPQDPSQPPQSPDQSQGPPQAPSLIEAFEGDVRFKVRDPRDVFVPPGCMDIREASRICIRESLEVSAARKRFPKFAQFIHSEDGMFSDKTARWRYNFLDTSTATEWLTDHVYVFKYLESPTEAYPDGRIIFMINDMIVEESPGHFDALGRHPLYHFGFDVNDGEFWREPFLTHAWHRQRELDAVETLIREHVELMLRPKWLVPSGARISQDEFTPTSAQIVEYNAMAGKPMPLELPQLPQAIYQRRTDLGDDMRMQASVTEQEQGLTTSDPNGRAMAIINAEADQTIGPITVRNHSEWREMHRAALIFVQKFYHPDRKITVSGPEGIQTYSFNEANLEPGWDLQIEDADGLSRNPAIRFNETLQLAQVGNGAFFADPHSGQFDKKAFARMAKLKLPEQGYDAEATERAAAQRIPYRILRGEQPIPDAFDEPTIFYEELLGWLRGPGRTADPMVKQKVQVIWQYYTTWKTMLQLGMLAPNVLPPMGGPQGAPGEGQPSQPGQGGPSAPGGSPNNPGMLGTDLAPGIKQEANQKVQTADQTGESMAQKFSKPQ